MRGTTAPRLVLELLCARMMLPDASVDAAAVLQRVERLERRLSAADPPASPPAQSESAAKSDRTGGEAAVPAAAPAAELPASPPLQSESAAKSDRTGGEAGQPDVDGVDMRRLWPQVLDVISRSSKTIWAMLDGSQVTESGEGTVTLSVAPSLAKRLGEERNVAVVAAAITSLIGGAWRVDVQAGAGRNGPAASGKAEPDVDPRDDTDYEAPSANGEAAPPADPEADALRLLRDELGARPLE
jgi:DNA polymerase-3 subunit gamma/tau